MFVSTYEYNGNVCVLCCVDRVVIDRSVGGSLVNQVEGLGLVQAKLESLNLHWHTGAVNASDSCARSPCGLDCCYQVSFRGRYPGLYYTTFGGDVEANGEVLDIGEVYVVVGSPGTVVNCTYLLFLSHSGAYGHAFRAGVVLGGVVAVNAAVSLLHLEVCYVKEVALALGIGTRDKVDVYGDAAALKVILDSSVRAYH